MKKAPNVDGIIGRLLILKKIEPGEKLRVNPDGSFTVDAAGYFQFLRRSVLVGKSSRNETVNGLAELVQEVNQYSDTLLDSKSLGVIEHKGHINELESAAFHSKFQDLCGLKTALETALPGLENLQETYKDTNIEINIQLTRNNLQSTASLIDERVRKINQRLPYVQIYDTNRARIPRSMTYMVESHRDSHSYARSQHHHHHHHQLQQHQQQQPYLGHPTPAAAIPAPLTHSTSTMGFSPNSCGTIASSPSSSSASSLASSSLTGPPSTSSSSSSSSSVPSAASVPSASPTSSSSSSSGPHRPVPLPHRLKSHQQHYPCNNTMHHDIKPQPQSQSLQATATSLTVPMEIPGAKAQK